MAAPGSEPVDCQTCVVASKLGFEYAGQYQACLIADKNVQQDTALLRRAWPGHYSTALRLQSVSDGNRAVDSLMSIGTKTSAGRSI